MKYATSLLALLLSVLVVHGQEPRPTGYKPPTAERRTALYAADRVRNGSRVAQAAKMATPPAKFDCVEMGWVPPVRDQGNCGSCYGVATADQLTTAFIKAGYQKNDDSFEINFQFGLDRCGPDFGGCNGGWGAEVAEWMVKNGFPAERYVDARGTQMKDYPAYEARQGQCREAPGAKRWKPAAWGFCSGSEGRAATKAEIQVSLMQYGVVNIAFNATNAYSNAGAKVVRISGQANHETTLVGWDEAKGWKTRGNWGKGLGVDGYVWFTFDSQLVDPFWMTATPLPPLPPDPLPPIPPVPGGTDSITITLGGRTQSFELFPVGSRAAMIAEREARIKALQDEIDKLKRLNEPPEPPKADPCCGPVSWVEWLDDRGFWNYSREDSPDYRKYLSRKEKP